ncbi:hypothetical protein [Pseudomonas phage D6]|nr:hypothetical protein [Pseudomonas phage D6]
MIAQAFKEMGPFGKIVVCLMVASTVKSCASHIATTVKLRKESK